MGWLRRTSERATTKTDLFAVLDVDNNGKLVREEFKWLYKVMDMNGDINLSGAEVKAWIDANMDSVCAMYRPAMLAARKA